MPVKHDLYADLKLTREQVAERRNADKKLNQLLDDYARIDSEVLAAESGPAGGIGDEELKKLKEKRLAIKDWIVQRVEVSE
ncbi:MULTISPECIES: DUF465 domain-containing protein [Pseudomonas]|uniref:DUF465 domain-containing protein n=1 Tax=Pseudomonas phytophila TaxID=2867264 RepID=A0ABY6FMR1_9PSED|nr:MULTISPECIES: DUF465 domain-containing protein [Pseudomonas]MCD5991421.1 YdcH family protein [Pseudomonas quasicaspiana]MDU8360340.1 DUF465 domain-containing protein [Pseudomonas syringae group sp. J309-1]PHN27548.1 hypothetical protein AO242_27945 [Pseudomonas sp. ICMP 561]UXZ99170.1 DUF465 domain-containing protein [Pseudomonas phytophila]